jgi:two-component system, cell cycle response regulator DivK
MKTALIIEDNADNSVLMSRILEKSGYGTVTAETGRDGYDMARRTKPDFILLDIQLPDMDGTEVLRMLLEAPETRDIPIISVTSYAMSGDEERLIAAGCTGYIEKPIDPMRVIKQIEEILGSRP